MLTDTLIVTKREIRDSLRDWRIVAPILILTLIFPWIMNQSTRVAINFVEQYQATIIPLRLIPFALMVVGFFPISFSLVIALETFVGEKERNSLEPLLATPVSDAALYLGKLLSATLPPLCASYLGIAVYLASLYVSVHYLPEPIVLLQILLLTTAEALVMVAGAVVVSSHTTSVRAANLLASFIIIPMAFLLMGETVLLFWGQYDVLWCIILGLIVTLLILTRTGTQTFNREEILAHEIDELNLGRTVRLFWHCFVGERFSLIRVYGRDLPQILKANALPIGVAVLVLAAGMVFGWIFALQHPLPREMIGTLQVSQEAFTRDLPSTGFEFLPRLDTTSIFWHNVQALVLEVLLGIFSFGSLALILLLAPMGIVGFATGEIALAGINPLVFLLAFILPHGLFELPAAILATALALRLGAAVMSPPRGLSVGENFIRALADLVKVFVFLILPLLLVAAFVEANITPQIVIYFFGR